jgi:hypothetical protein
MSEARTPEEDMIGPRNNESPPSRAEGDAGPTPEEEMRGAQPPNDSPDDSVVEHQTQATGKTADIVDLDELDSTGSGRSAHKSPRSDDAGTPWRSVLVGPRNPYWDAVLVSRRLRM